MMFGGKRLEMNFQWAQNLANQSAAALRHKNEAKKWKGEADKWKVK